MEKKINSCPKIVPVILFIIWLIFFFQFNPNCIGGWGGEGKTGYASLKAQLPPPPKKYYPLIPRPPPKYN